MLRTFGQAVGLLRGKTVESAITCFQRLETLSISQKYSAEDQTVDPAAELAEASYL